MVVAKSTNWRIARTLIAGLLACMLACVFAVFAQPTQQAYAEHSEKMYRLYNPNSGEHFFTKDLSEKNNLVRVGWTFEGDGWTAPTMGDPVYRLYNPNAGEHHYTPDVSERDNLTRAGWKYEGVGWYTDPAINVPMYRLYNPNAYANNHHYTRDTKERDWLRSLGWKYEGTGWYGVDPGDYFATIYIKDKGKITVSLNDSAAPKTTANFVKLAKSGFYDGLDFHRIIKGFMMQGGDPLGTGGGGSDEHIFGEFSDNGFNNPISHTRGAISMARSDSYNSASSQFFIMHKDGVGQNGHYAAFGHVIGGMDIVDDICESAKPTDINGSIPKAQRPVIEKITIGTF